MKRSFTLFALLLLIVVSLPSQEPVSDKCCETATFLFAPGEEKFILQGNEAELQRLYSLIDKYRNKITTGRMPVYVDGYCASLPTPKENLRTAFIRANRIKSELITQKGLEEADFITGNYARAYHNNKDIVVVMLRIPAQPKEKQPEPARKQPRKKEPPVITTQQPEPEKGNAFEPIEEKQSEPTVESSASPKLYHFAVRTNVLYDAFLLPTLGIEWRINNNIGIRLDGSCSWWGGDWGEMQKIWLLSPEVRWYLLRNKRFYVGVSGNYGEYNVYGRLIGNLLSNDTGYKGHLWSAGLTVGYRLPLWRCFSADFNLGLGYTRFHYDSFTAPYGARIYKQHDRKKNFWGPTQTGISLIWTI